MTPNQTIYIVTAIHCPSAEGVNPNCYSITGAYSTAPAAQAAMLSKAKELFSSPVKHWHGHPTEGKPEWKESPFKVEFRGDDGDFGVCWVDERVLGVDEMPIDRTLKLGRFGIGHKGEGSDDYWGMSDDEVERTLSGVLRF